MIELESRLSDNDRIAMERTYNMLNLEWRIAPYPRCWGGEFVCGDTSSLRLLLEGCDVVYARMNDLGVFSERGDEFLLYVSANRVGFPAVPANGYVHRIWTGRYYTPSRHESYAVLHLPQEKNYAFPRAWRALEQGRLVDTNTFKRWCGLRPSKRPFDPVWGLSRVAQKVGP